MERARSKQPILPIVAFWTHQKLVASIPGLLPALNALALKDGTGPEPAAHTAKLRFLNQLETIVIVASNPGLPPALAQVSECLNNLALKDAKQTRTKQPILPNVAFWTD